MRGILQTQSAHTSNGSAAAATLENRGGDKSSVVAAETASALMDDTMEHPASTAGSTEMPELYLEINSQHTETLEV